MTKQWVSLLLAVVLLCAAGCACARDKLLILPADTRTIRAEAFYHADDLETVVLPEGLKTIGARAFAQSSLSAVNFPASLTSIAADAFDGCPELVVTAVPGTLGETYALDHGLKLSGLPSGPVDTGVYTLINQGSGSYLAWNDQTLSLSAGLQTWTLRQVWDGAFQVFAGDTELLLDIDNAWVEEGTAIKLWEPTGYDVQIWNLHKNSNGTYSILYSGDNRYCLGFKGGNATLQIRNTTDPWQEWRLTCVGVSSPWQYLSVMGKKGTVELRLPTDIESVIGKTRLQQWADQLETAYASFYELTHFRPYENIIVEAYKPSEYIGWVVDHSNIIHIDEQFLRDDLSKMAARTNDWNFCALHEMGHMFDMERPWNFESEFLTDLKLAYVVEQNNAGAAPSEFPADSIFYGADILDAYRDLGSDFSSEYSIYGFAARFLEIKEDIGWEPFKDTFHSLQSNEDLYAEHTNRQKLETFAELLSQYSGKRIRSYFSTAEWNTVLDACD